METTGIIMGVIQGLGFIVGGYNAVILEKKMETTGILL